MTNSGPGAGNRLGGGRRSGPNLRKKGEAQIGEKLVIGEKGNGGVSFSMEGPLV